MQRLVALGLVFFLAGPAAAQGVTLGTDWEATFEAAKERNVPVLFLLGRDGKTPWTTWFGVPAIAGAIEDRALVLVAHRGGEHKPETVVDRKTKEQTERCPVYPSITCDVHKGFYDEHAGRFDYDELPAAFLLRPDKGVMQKDIGGLPGKKLLEKLGEAQFSLGEGVFRSEVVKLEKGLAKGDKKRDDHKFKAARKIYEKPLKKELKAYLKAMVDKRLESLDAKALEAIEEAKGLQDAKKRHETLKRIAREMKGRAPAEAAEAALAEVEGG